VITFLYHDRVTILIIYALRST